MCTSVIIILASVNNKFSVAHGSTLLILMLASSAHFSIAGDSPLSCVQFILFIWLLISEGTKKSH